MRFCAASSQRDAAWLSASVILAPAAMLLVIQSLAPIAMASYMGYSRELPLTLPVIAALGGLALVVFFALNRSVARRTGATT